MILEIVKVTGFHFICFSKWRTGIDFFLGAKVACMKIHDIPFLITYLTLFFSEKRKSIILFELVR
jgi:hypothetical protein